MQCFHLCFEVPDLDQGFRILKREAAKKGLPEWMGLKKSSAQRNECRHCRVFKDPSGDGCEVCLTQAVPKA